MGLRIVLVASAAVFTVTSAAPMGAQGRIGAGQTVSGRLDASDYIRPDGTYYDDWFYEGRAGERITVTQRSSTLDSWLLLGRVVGGEFRLATYNDDAAGGDDARITYTLPVDGRYVIRANVVGRGRTGSYTLNVSTARAATPSPGSSILRAGQSVEGSLDASDPVWTDGTHYDLWRYQGRAGERVTFVMRSPAFNSYMSFGSLSGDAFTYIEGSTSRTVGGQQETVLDVTLPRTGAYGIRANSHGKRTGPYVLSVSSSGAVTSTTPATRPAAARTTPANRSAAAGRIAYGQMIRSSLQRTDVQTDSGWYHKDYTFSGSAGDIVYVDLVAREFDPYLDLYKGTTRVASNDDGGEGMGARIAYTLPETGTYTICARSRYRNRTGPYTLALQRAGSR